MSDLVDGRSARVVNRCLYTGESPRMVRQQLKIDSDPVMPSPASNDQLELEASVWRSWMRAVARHRAVRLPTGSASLVNRVRLATRTLSLELDTHAVLDFLAESLPVDTGVQITGIPGLRPHAARTHLDLRLVGTRGTTDAVVRLLGVTRERWREAELAIGRFGKRLWLDGLHELHVEEASLQRTKAVEPIPLMSAALRRVFLWHEATWLDTSIDESSLLVCWRGGPVHSAVAESLEDALCGIPGVTIASRQLSDVSQGIAIAMSDGSSQQLATLHASLGEAGRIVLTVSTQRSGSAVGSPIPVQLWDQEEMRDALARREISSVYRLLRRHGVTQRQIASLTGQSQSEVSEILKGRQVMAYDVLTRIACGLGVPRGYMGLAYDEPTVVSTAAPFDVDDDERVRRRKMLAHAAAVTVGAAVFGSDSGSWVSHPTQTRAPRRVDMTDVRQIEAATRALRAIDHQFGADACRGALDAQIAWARQLLDAPAPDHVKDKIEAAFVNLQALAD